MEKTLIGMGIIIVDRPKFRLYFFIAIIIIAAITMALWLYRM